MFSSALQLEGIKSWLFKRRTTTDKSSLFSLARLVSLRLFAPGRSDVRSLGLFASGWSRKSAHCLGRFGRPLRLLFSRILCLKERSHITVEPGRN